MSSRKAGPVAAFIIGVVMLLIGGGVGFFIGKPILDRAKASESWPTADGKVIESELRRSRDNDGDSTYSADIVYEYRVDGEAFEGDEIWFGQYSSSNRSEMNELVREYPAGQNVVVYYSPDDPSTAVLKPGAFTSSYMVYGIGLVFFGVGCLLVAVPLIKLVVVAVFVATSPRNSFAGGGPQADDSDFPTGRFDNDRLYDATGDDDDGFAGIPGS